MDDPLRVHPPHDPAQFLRHGPPQPFGLPVGSRSEPLHILREAHSARHGQGYREARRAPPSRHDHPGRLERVGLQQARTAPGPLGPTAQHAGLDPFQPIPLQILLIVVLPALVLEPGDLGKGRTGHRRPRTWGLPCLPGNAQFQKALRAAVRPHPESIPPQEAIACLQNHADLAIPLFERRSRVARSRRARRVAILAMSFLAFLGSKRVHPRQLVIIMSHRLREGTRTT